MKKTLFYLTSISVFVIIGFVLALSLVPSLSNQEVSAIEDAPAPITEAEPLLVAQEAAFAEIYNSLAPSVVAITIYVREGRNDEWQPYSAGSGFMVDTEGHLVTNYHVVLPATDVEDIVDDDAEALIEVRMFDGTIAEAEVVGTDPNADIAVIQVDVSADRLHPVAWGDSEAMYEGQLVFALGNPFANDWTLTSGIVSAVNRSIPGLADYAIGGVIQTDAAINPGNSGGPLVNLRGEVVGINSQIISESGTSSGIGFAVPSNLAIRVAEALINDGEMQYSYMGVGSIPINLALIQDYDLPNNIRGVAIDDVRSNSPADDAGLEDRSNSSIDIITAINDVPMADFDEMLAYLSIHTSPGDVIHLTVYRDGEVLQIDLTLGERPN